MFGAPPPPSPAELKAQTDATNTEIKFTALACVVLYLSPFFVDAARKLV